MSRRSLGLLVVLLMSSTFTHAQDLEGELIVRPVDVVEWYHQSTAHMQVQHWLQLSSRHT